MLILGYVIFALGIVISVCLHEAGHMVSAKAFGMKVTRYFVGFGKTLWSFRRGETEYGIKALPFGGFVKIVGMTPQDDDVEPGDEKRAMWRFPVWKRTVVMVSGSVTHFMIGFVILWGVFAFSPMGDLDKTYNSAAVVEQVAPCVKVKFEVDAATGGEKTCQAGVDPQSPAAALGLRPGDKVLQVGDTPTPTWNDMTTAIRASGGKTITLTIVRDGQSMQTAPVLIPSTQRVKQGLQKPATEINVANDTEWVGQLGVIPKTYTTVYGPVAAIGQAGNYTGQMFTQTFQSLQKFPEKVPRLWSALTGAQRDPETPVSVVGATRIGGELFQRGEVPMLLLLLASLNFFVGIFNLFPLLPLDGGHVAIAWFERVRSWLYARLRKPEPGRVDYMKLMPLTYFVILVFGGITLLTLATDVVNPITLPK
jgi:membrane-associated protease RseP (regulator of RpoE activity)